MRAPVFLLISVAMALPASELVVRDLRVAAGSRPLAFSVTATTPTAESSGDDAFDAGLGLEVGGRWSFARPGDSLGLIAGGDVQTDGYTYASGGTLGVTALRGALGLGWAVNDSLTLTAECAYIMGTSALDLPATGSAPAFSATGTVTGYDVRAGGTWLLSRRFGVGMYAGWLSESHALSDSAVDLTLDQSNWYIGLEAVWRFSDAPPRLE